MAGKRLLDAAAIIKASRGIALQHVALRKHQLDSYSKTSSIATAVRSQTDSFTLLVKAASALNERTKRSGPTYSTGASLPDTSTKDDRVPSQDSVKGADGDVDGREGVIQDHFYEKSRKNAAAESPPQNNLAIQQEESKGYPVLDGSDLPTGTAASKTMRDEEGYHASQQNSRGQEGQEPASSGRINILAPAGSCVPPKANRTGDFQQQADKPIPFQTAESPSVKASEKAWEIEAANSPRLEKPENNIAHEDVFHKSSTYISKILPPRTQFEMQEDKQGSQESGEQVSHACINQDVHYSAIPEDQWQTIPRSQAIPEQNELSEKSHSETFNNSTSIAPETISPKANKNNMPGNLDLPGADENTMKQTKAAREADEVSFSMRTQAYDRSQPSNPSSTTLATPAPDLKGKEDVHRLAADMAEDVNSMTSENSEVSMGTSDLQVSY